ncbi:MAG: hypothetical protein WCT20_05490, partial [Candidatus Babeliales bacterium]
MTAPAVSAATTTEAKIQMGLALAAAPLEIAANKNLANNNNEKANLLFLAADTLNLLNDACFLYNNVN